MADEVVDDPWAALESANYAPSAWATEDDVDEDALEDSVSAFISETPTSLSALLGAGKPDDPPTPPPYSPHAYDDDYALANVDNYTVHKVVPAPRGVSAIVRTAGGGGTVYNSYDGVSVVPVVFFAVVTLYPSKTTCAVPWYLSARNGSVESAFPNDTNAGTTVEGYLLTEDSGYYVDVNVPHIFTMDTLPEPLKSRLTPSRKTPTVVGLGVVPL